MSLLNPRDLIDDDEAFLPAIESAWAKIVGFDAAFPDSDLTGHSRRVASNAMAIARQAGFSQRDVFELGAACLTHDLGKLDVGNSILNKPGILTDIERAEMRRHAHYGFLALRGIPDLPAVFTLVARFHHESFDGKGYEGLQGDAIPAAARIVQIADVHDALCSRRVYKPGEPEGKIICAMIRPSRGGLGRAQFDPHFLRLFSRLRLADPDFAATAPERAEIEAFAASEPVLDHVHAQRASATPELPDVAETSPSVRL